MKKILSLILMMLPVLAVAATDDSKYLRGAVPEENGQIVFKTTFRVDGQTDAQIMQKLNQWCEQLVEQSIPAPGKFARIMETTDNSITTRACQWIEFKRKPLVLDRARMRYQFTANVDNGMVSLRLYQIRYYYGEDEELSNNQDIKAEEWISDSEALNKQGTKLYPKSGKFRRKTVDYVQQLFADAQTLFSAQNNK